MDIFFHFLTLVPLGISRYKWPSVSERHKSINLYMIYSTGSRDMTTSNKNVVISHELGAHFQSLPMGNCLRTRQLSPGSHPCTNTARLALLYLTICLSALPAGVWTCSECCHLNSFAQQIGLEGCAEMGAKPFDIINDTTSWGLLFQFNTWPVLKQLWTWITFCNRHRHCVSLEPCITCD